MNCDKCEYFKVIQEPITLHGVVVDWGRVECKKYNLIADVQKFSDVKKLKCPDCKKENKMEAVWVVDYDFRKDKCYNAPGCPECREPIGLREDGKYHCFSCGNEVEVTNEEMIEWLKAREETKTEYMDCPKITTKDGEHTSGCGGDKCVETHYMRNPVTLEWQVMGGKCSKCGMRFIV